FGANDVITSSRSLSRMFSAGGCSDTPPPVQRFDEAAILRDRNNRYWYGRSDTLFRFNTATGQEEAVLPGLRPLCLLDRRETVYIGNADWWYLATGGSLDQVYRIYDRNLSIRPTSLFITPQGFLWMATCTCVYQARGDGGWDPVPGLKGYCARALAVLDSGIY